jgi:hypothetical protein
MLEGQPPQEVDRLIAHWRGTAKRIPPKATCCHPLGTELTEEPSTTERGERVSVFTTSTAKGPLTMSCMPRARTSSVTGANPGEVFDSVTRSELRVMRRECGNGVRGAELSSTTFIGAAHFGVLSGEYGVWSMKMYELPNPQMMPPGSVLTQPEGTEI